MRRLLLALALLAFAIAFVLPPIARRLAPAAAAIPAPERVVAIGGGLSLNVRDVGAGAPVVLVHGLPSSLADWADVPDRLAGLGHRVVAYDRVGYGHASRADAGDDAYTLAANARHLGALLDALAIERADLVGWSYGGGIVQVFAEESPARVGRIVLLASVGPASATASDTDPLERLAASPIGPAVFGWVASVPQVALPIVGAAVTDAFSGPERIPPGWIERTAAQLAMPGTIDAWIRETRNGGYETLRPESIAAPALVLHGTDDLAVHLAVGEDLARRLPSSALELVEGGSHMLPATHPDRIAQSIHAWVSAR